MAVPVTWRRIPALSFLAARPEECDELLLVAVAVRAADAWTVWAHFGRVRVCRCVKGASDANRPVSCAQLAGNSESV